MQLINNSNQSYEKLDIPEELFQDLPEGWYFYKNKVAANYYVLKSDPTDRDTIELLIMGMNVLDDFDSYPIHDYKSAVKFARDFSREFNKERILECAISICEYLDINLESKIIISVN